MNSQVTRNMSLEQMVQTQLRIARSWGQHWTRRQAALQLWHLGWITDAELETVE